MITHYEAKEIFRKWRLENSPSDFITKGYKRHPAFEYVTVAISIYTGRVFLNYTDLLDNDPYVCDVCGVCCSSLVDFNKDIEEIDSIELCKHLDQIDDHYWHHGLVWEKSSRWGVVA